MKKFGLLIILFSFVGVLNAQIVLDGINVYSQDFNTLAISGTTNTTIPTGWFFSESGTNANTFYSAGTGSGTAGDTYSFGAAANTDRTFGGLRSGTLIPTIGANFINNTGFAITQIPINYTGEQWRAGVLNRNAADRLDFQLSTDATSLTTGTWTDYNALDFSSPNINTAVGALDGNATVNRVGIQYLITGLNIVNGATFWIRWTDFDITSSDDGLGIDDFSIDIQLPVELTSFSAATIGSTVKLSWNTATEINNYGFEVERKVGSLQSTVGNYEKIGFVNGSGNSNSPKNYSYEDKNLSAGKYSYRLKQIDNDGQFEYSKAIEVDFNSAKKFELSQNYPNPFNPATTIRFNLPEAGNVKITLYNLLGQQIRTLVNEYKESGVHTINFDASDLNSGMYIYKIEAGSFVQTRKMTLVK